MVLALSDKSRVVGFVTAITDGVSCAYIPHLEVLPEWQGDGSGTELMRRMMAKLETIRGLRGRLYWSEAELIVHSEFRDGNVPAGHQQLRVLIEALGRLPAGVEKVMLRSDTAGYQRELLRYCAEGRDERFGVIEFAVGVDVTAEFRRAVSEVAEQDWQTLYRKVGEHRVDTGQQWAEVTSCPTG